MSEALVGFEERVIPFQEVRIISALAGSLRRHARTQMVREDASGYVLYDTKWAPRGSGAEETFMGVVWRQPDVDYKQMTVSFRTYELSEEAWGLSTLEQYRYNWNTTGQCTGVKIHREMPAPDNEKLVYPLSPEDNLALLERMQFTGRAAVQRPLLSPEEKWEQLGSAA